MKLISHNDVSPTFKVDYFGLLLTIPREYLDGYVFTNQFGCVNVTKKKPELNKWGSFWLYPSGLYIAKVDLEEIKWQNSLVSIRDHKVSKSL